MSIVGTVSSLIEGRNMRSENITRIVERANREIDLLDHNAEHLRLQQVRALYLGIVLVGTIATAALTLYENRF